MEPSTQRKRIKLATPSANTKNKRRTIIIPRTVRTSMNNSSNVATKNYGKPCQTNSPTLIQNNRELAVSLNKARTRIKELEDQKYILQGDKQELMEKNCAALQELKILKEAAMPNMNTKAIKETCQSLRSNVHIVAKKLLESSEFLSTIEKSVTALQKISNSYLSIPLHITCDNTMERSEEAASSITKLTPSPSSSSDRSIEMTSPNCFSTPSQPAGLLTTIEDHESTFSNQTRLDSEKTSASARITSQESMQDISSFNLALNSSLASLLENDIFDRAEESAINCNNFVHNKPCLIGIDSPASNSNKDGSLELSRSAPDCSPILRYTRSSVHHRLASTPEDSEVSRFAANLSGDTPQISPAFILCSGRRMSRRRHMIEGFCGYKEPTINGKLRQGDPFTDSRSLYLTGSKNKRKNKKPGENVKKKSKQ